LRLRKFYLNENPPSKFLSTIKRYIKNPKSIFIKVKPKNNSTWEDLFKEAQQWLIDVNKERKVGFLS
jgi:hypothetical protein